MSNFTRTLHLLSLFDVTIPAWQSPRNGRHPQYTLRYSRTATGDSRVHTLVVQFGFHTRQEVSTDLAKTIVVNGNNAAIAYPSWQTYVKDALFEIFDQYVNNRLSTVSDKVLESSVRYGEGVSFLSPRHQIEAVFRAAEAMREVGILDAIYASYFLQYLKTQDVVAILGRELGGGSSARAQAFTDNGRWFSAGPGQRVPAFDTTRLEDALGMTTNDVENGLYNATVAATGMHITTPNLDYYRTHIADYQREFLQTVTARDPHPMTERERRQRDREVAQLLVYEQEMERARNRRPFMVMGVDGPLEITDHSGGVPEPIRRVDEGLDEAEE